MAPNQVHLPNGQTLNVTPVFGGLYFRSNDLSQHHNVFPPGWTIILNSEHDGHDDDDDDREQEPERGADGTVNPDATPRAETESRKQGIHRFRRPSLKNDHLYISSISNPASSEFRPPTSPTRQIAMMLWATLYWYFHQQEPEPQLRTAASHATPDAGKPQGEWRIYINKEGIFKSKHVLPKLERMGLVASEDSSVGLDPMDGLSTLTENWNKMFVSRRTFWQMDPRIYLFTLTPLQTSYPAISPNGSRPSSPSRNSKTHDTDGGSNLREAAASQSTSMARAGPPGPFHSASHLPTYYPPPPVQYGFTNNCRHPIRPKPPRQGETFYIRYIPSLGQYLTFRVASLSKRPITYPGPFSQAAPDASLTTGEARETTNMTDVELLHKWMNDPRVSHSWGEQGPQHHQEEFLKNGLLSKHSIPVIGCFDGKPFGYFEIYWVKEDRLASYLGGAVDDFDRGLHVLVGEQEFRGQHRFKVWMSALVHLCFIGDSRTNVVMMEPRVDNEK